MKTGTHKVATKYPKRNERWSSKPEPPIPPKITVDAYTALRQVKGQR